MANLIRLTGTDFASTAEGPGFGANLNTSFMKSASVSVVPTSWRARPSSTAGRYPPSYARYSVWLTTLTMLIETAPAAAETVNVYWTKLHTIDGTSSTVPARFEDVIADGAGGFAALEWVVLHQPH